MKLLVRKYRPLTGNSKQHIVLLYGVNGYPENLKYIIDCFRRHFKDAYISVPYILYVDDEGGEHFRWYNRFLVLSEMLTEIEISRKEISSYMDYIAKEEGISFSKTILCGFSQGAEMAIYTGLRSQKNLGGIISFSGKVILPNILDSVIKKKQDILLIHGKKDQIVSYSYLAEGKKLLEKHCIVETYTSNHADHSISKGMATKAVYFITKKLKFKNKDIQTERLNV